MFVLVKAQSPVENGLKGIDDLSFKGEVYRLVKKHTD